MLGYLPLPDSAILIFSLLSVGAYLLSLLLLPPGRDHRAAAMIALAIPSVSGLLAVERANNDLLIFALLAAGAALLAQAQRARLAGYALIFTAALLKYFPLIAMMAALRERTPRLLAIAAISTVMLAAFIGLTWEPLIKSLQAIPGGDYGGWNFGAKVLPGAMAHFSLLSPRGAVILRGGLTLAALGIGIWLGRSARLQAALTRLTEAERSFMLVGALVGAGVFFASQNNLYRGIMMILALPGLIALNRCGAPRWFRPAPWLLLVMLWWNALAKGSKDATLAYAPGAEFVRAVVVWFLREPAWWCLITLLVTVAAAELARAPIFGLFSSRQLRAEGSSR